MENENTYNGWRNYETWLVNLWIDNDNLLDGFDTASTDAYQVGAMMQAEIEPWLDELEVNGLFRDLLIAAWQKIDWKQLGASYIENREAEGTNNGQ